MRDIVIRPAAEDAITILCDFVEAKNTKGSGGRFHTKLLDFIEGYAPLTNLKFPLCKNEELALLYYSCLIFQQKWVIAFTYDDEQITIHRVLLGSGLK